MHTPREKLYIEAAAYRAGLALSTWRNYTSAAASRGGRRLAPEPDGTDLDKGHARPWWYPETVDAWKASRPGRGARTDLRER